jgi:hypothetical protein
MPLEIKSIKSVAEKKKVKTNPYKANQHRPDPRQQLFLKYYLDPAEKNTFSNCYQSAIKAGYEKEYAESLTAQMPTWLSESLGNSKRLKMLEKAERNLEEMLELPNKVIAIGAFGPIINKNTKEVIMKLAPDILKIKADVSKFLAKTVGNKHYSEKLTLDGSLTVEDLMNKNREDRRKPKGDGK